MPVHSNKSLHHKNSFWQAEVGLVASVYYEVYVASGAYSVEGVAHVVIRALRIG